MNNKETELRVADLFAMLLKAFVPILCVALVAGLLGGAFGFYRAKHREPSVTKEDLVAADKAVISARNAVRTAERNLNRQNEIDIPEASRQITNNENLVARRQAYMENSLLQQLDAFHCGVSRIKLYVKSDVADTVERTEEAEQTHNAVAMAYAEGYLHDSALIKEIRTILNTTADDPYVLEMASVSNPSERFVEIVAYHEDAAVAERVANAIYATLSQRLQKTVAPHEANIIGTYTGYEVNWVLYEQQIKNEDNLLLAQRTLEEARNQYRTLTETLPDKEQTVTDAQLTYEDAVAKQADLQKQYENTAPSKRNMLKGLAVYGVVGAAAGLVLACVVVWLKNLLNGKLHNQTEAKSRYAFPLIGVLSRKKKRLFEKAICKLEGDPLGSFADNAQATTQSLLRQIGDRSVCLVSSLGGATAETLAAFTNGKTPVCGNILNDAEAIKALDGYDAVVLLEQRDQSRIDLIDAEVLRLQSLRKDVVGMVLL